MYVDEQQQARTDTEGNGRAVRDVPVDEIDPSPYQPRNEIDTGSEAFRELSEDIGRRGILVVPSARMKNGRYELLYGERRWRAAMAAGLSRIPMLVFEGMSDAEAAERVVGENLQRKDLSPIEESRGVDVLLTQYGGDVRAVAARLGRTEKWVRLRAKLQDLSPKWRKEMSIPESFVSEWGIGHLEVIARFPEHVQDHAFNLLNDDWQNCRYTVAELERWCEREIMHSLSAAAWDVEDESVVECAPACSVCRKRSSQAGLLFDAGDEDGSDVCLDVTCWHRKFEAAMRSEAAKLKAQHGKVLFVVNGGSYEERRRLREVFGDDCRTDYEITRTRKNTPGAMPAVNISGPRVGKVSWVVPRDASSSHAAGRPSKTMKQKRAELESKRWAWVIDELKVRLAAVAWPDVIVGGTELAAVGDDKRATALLKLVAAFGCRAELQWGKDAEWPSRTPWAALERATKTEAADLEALMWNAVRLKVAERLQYYQKTNVRKEQRDNARHVCGLLGLACDDLVGQACVAVPEPKSWTKAAAKKAKNRKKS